MKKNLQVFKSSNHQIPKFLLLSLLFLPLYIQAAIYSFEDAAIPAGFSGNITVSGDKYKLGRQSLCWNPAGGATLTLANPSNLSAASQSATGGIMLWIYNTSPSTESLDFRFQNVAGVRKCALSFRLNFRGWRCLWARFADDMRHDRSALATMTVHAPATVSGKIYLDYLEFSSNVSWERMSDAQYTVKAGSGLDDFVAVRAANPASFPTAPDAAQRQAMQTVASRLESWFFPSTHLSDTHVARRTSAFNSYIRRGRDKMASLSLARAADGTVAGPGLFQQFAGTAIDGTPVTRFRDINEQYLIQLACDFRKNGNAAALTVALDIFDWMHDQGWDDGSAMGSLRFEKLRSSGYFYGLFLLRNHLGVERLERELRTLNWMSLAGASFLPRTAGGENADDVRTLHIARLIYALSHPDDNVRLACLKAFSESLDSAFDSAPGYLDVFKPDFSGYHHRGVYYSSYYPEALYSACLMYYLLHDTPFALSDDVYRRLKQALLAFRFICAGYDVPVSTAGRFPEATTTLDGLLPAFALLLLSRQETDEALAAAFKRGWQPDADPLKSRIGRAAPDITFRSTVGEVVCMVQAAALPTPAEDALTGAVYQPFAGLMVARTPCWLLSVKGMSKYVWDYEASSSENLYGRYLSNGHLEWTDLQTGRRSFNSTAPGWDWSRLPGTTYRKLPAVELHFVNAGSRHRNFPPEAFLGGVVLNDTIALFSMKLAGLPFDNTFRARKSVFLAGNTLYCIGSNIYSEDAAHVTETALFQNAFSPSAEQIRVNGNPVSVSQADLKRPVITDNYGNTYRVFSAGTVSVDLSASLATAYISHGAAPANTVYQYGVVFGGGDESVLSGIDVRQRDAGAHCLYEPRTQTMALAAYTAADNLNCGHVKRVNAPSLMLIQETGNGLYIVFSDPDMRQATAGNSDSLSDAAVATPGQPFNYELEIYGAFRPASGETVQASTDGQTTTIRATVREGNTYQIRLERPASGLDGIAAGDVFSCTLSGGRYTIRSAAHLSFGFALTDISGRVVHRREDCRQTASFTVDHLSRGVYILHASDGQHVYRRKILMA
jgi:chondroitin-sulfate-ABC endolyase/exolyase